ncbi:MAG: 5'/3'-nucleotidase SurE [Bilophila sp.]
MRILLSNDDGIYAPSLRALYQALSEAGHAVRVVAPLTEQSAVSGSVTVHSPLRVHELHEDNGFCGTAVNGTPVDCIKLALTTLLSEPPELCVVGINAGCNIGTDVFYSGTVGAASEAAMFGIPSVAFSRPVPETEPPLPCARHAAGLIKAIDWGRLPPCRVLNVNYPRRLVSEIRGVRVGRMSTTPWEESYEERTDPSGRPYWWISGYLKRPAGGEDTDISLIRAGFVALTPLQVDRTDEALLRHLQESFVTS